VFDVVLNTEENRDTSPCFRDNSLPQLYDWLSEPKSILELIS